MPHYYDPLVYGTTSSHVPSPPSHAADLVPPEAYYRGHRRGDSGYRSRCEDEGNDEYEDERERRHRRPRHPQTESSAYAQPQVDHQYYDYPPAPTQETRYPHAEGIPVPAPYSNSYTHHPPSARPAPAPKITVSAWEEIEYGEYGYTYYPESQHIHHHQQRQQQQQQHYPEPESEHEYYGEEETRRRLEQYYSRYQPESSQDYHRHHSPPRAGAHDLRRIPSAASNTSIDRYTSSSSGPPSPTAEERARVVNRYGRVPRWYEEREAFTRYS